MTTIFNIESRACQINAELSSGDSQRIKNAKNCLYNLTGKEKKALLDIFKGVKADATSVKTLSTKLERDLTLIEDGKNVKKTNKNIIARIKAKIKNAFGKRSMDKMVDKIESFSWIEDKKTAAFNNVSTLINTPVSRRRNEIDVMRKNLRERSDLEDPIWNTFVDFYKALGVRTGASMHVVEQGYLKIANKNVGVQERKKADDAFQQLYLLDLAKNIITLNSTTTVNDVLSLYDNSKNLPDGKNGNERLAIDILSYLYSLHPEQDLD